MMVGTMADEPTTPELKLELDALAARVAREREDQRRDMREGFGRIEAAISKLSFVNPDVYLADQRRQDESVEGHRAWLESISEERRQDRKLLLGSLLFPLLIAVVGIVFVLPAGG